MENLHTPCAIRDASLSEHGDLLVSLALENGDALRLALDGENSQKLKEFLEQLLAPPAEE
jgi:hypothetical protein